MEITTKSLKLKPSHSVKWVNRIILSSLSSTKKWQRQETWHWLVPSKKATIIWKRSQLLKKISNLEALLFHLATSKLNWMQPSIWMMEKIISLWLLTFSSKKKLENENFNKSWLISHLKTIEIFISQKRRLLITTFCCTKAQCVQYQWITVLFHIYKLKNLMTMIL